MIPLIKRLGLLALLLLVASCQRQPAPTAVPDALAPRPTRTPTGQPPATPTRTPTPPATSTPGTPMPPHDHDVTVWHEPDGHHHGANPADYPELWELYLEQTAGQQIGYPWLSSVFENVYPFPMGNHEGFKFLAQKDTNCAQTGRPSGYYCIKSYLYMVHTMGTAHHMYTRVHSHYGVFEVCTLDGEQCGLIATGGHMDVGVLHNLYKQEICQLPGDPPSFPYLTAAGLNRIPYRALLNNSERPPKNGFNGQFWQYLGPGPGNIINYPHIPNYTLGASWTEVNAWEYVDGEACANPERVTVLCPDGNANGDCAYTADTYQVFSIRLQNLPTERPYNGFTNVDGHIDKTCQEASPICVPFVIEAAVPCCLDGALLGYGVRQGQCDEVECQYYGGDGLLLPPGYEGH